MSTITNSSYATTIDRIGGECLAIRVTWTTGEQVLKSYFMPTDLFKMVVKKEDPATPGTYLDIGPSGSELTCHSGIPGDVDVLHHINPVQSAIGRYAVVESPAASGLYINTPVYQTVKGYMPRLSIGIYYVQLQRYNTGTSLYANYGTPVAVWCQNPLRDEIIYSLKSSFPSEVYLTGAQDISEGGV
jgi:hypothetical protein